MYYTPTNQQHQSAQMVQFPANGQQQQFSTIQPYTQQQPFLVQPQQNVYPQQNQQFFPVNITSQGNPNYVQMAGTPMNSSANTPQQYNQVQPQPQYRHNRNQTVPIASDDERYRKQLIVNYLAPDVTKEELHGLFSRFGPLDGARVIYDKQTNMPRGYGFVYFHYPEGAREAVEKMNGHEFHGKRLKVGFSTNPLNIISSGSTQQYQQDTIQ